MAGTYRIIVLVSFTALLIRAKVVEEYLLCHTGHVVSVNNELKVNEVNETQCGKMHEQSCIRATNVIEVTQGLEVQVVIYECLANNEISSSNCDKLSKIFDQLGFPDEHNGSTYQSCDFQICNTTLCNGTTVDVGGANTNETDTGGGAADHSINFLLFLLTLLWSYFSLRL